MNSFLCLLTHFLILQGFLLPCFFSYNGYLFLWDFKNFIWSFHIYLKKLVIFFFLYWIFPLNPFYYLFWSLTFHPGLSMNISEWDNNMLIASPVWLSRPCLLVAFIFLSAQLKIQPFNQKSWNAPISGSFLWGQSWFPITYQVEIGLGCMK